MYKVLIATRLNAVAQELLESHGGYQVAVETERDVAQGAARHPDSQALIVRSEAVTRGVMDALPELRVIVRAGTGYNTIDVEHARSRGIDVMNTPAANANAVAEEVIAMILADARHIIAGDASVRDGRWEKKDLMGRELAGKTVGIIGLGNIGQTLARRLSGFDVRLLGTDPVISPIRAEQLDINLVDIKQLFSESDYITLHIPENDETRGLVDDELLACMKPGATLINCARAGLINEDAMRAARAEKGIRLLNDVYPADEAGPKPIAELADIVMPHLGASTIESNENAARRAAEQLIDFTERGITSFIVNREIPLGLDETYCKLVNTLSRLCRGLSGKDSTLKMIETSFYGTLDQYADWLLAPLVAGLRESGDTVLDFRGAESYLSDRGIEYHQRDTDPQKNYGESITIDFTSSAGGETLRAVSVRGTVTEGNSMIARINEFDKLYLEPVGQFLFFVYDDRPGVLGQIGLSLAKEEINIEDVRNPHDPRTGHSLATMKVNRAPDEELLQSISEEIDAIAAFSVGL